jgi:soluble lytic murein transglycosylase
MSASKSKTTVKKQPYWFLKAVCTGVALGVAAVFAGPLLSFEDKAEQKFAQKNGISPLKAKQLLAANSKNPEDASAAGTAPAPGNAGDESPGNAAQPPSQIEKQEPIVEGPDTAKTPSPVTAQAITVALEPVLSFKIGDEDLKALKESIEAAAKDDDAGASAAAKKIVDPAAKLFAEWRRLHSFRANFRDAMTFRAAHPLFPEPPQTATFERNLLFSDAPADSVLKFYTNRVPISGAGFANLGAALIDTGEKEQGSQLIKYAWNRYALDSQVEGKILSRHGARLDAGDHARRKNLLGALAAYQEDPGKKLAASPAKKKQAEHTKKKRGAIQKKSRPVRQEPQKKSTPVRQALAHSKIDWDAPAPLYQPIQLKKDRDKKAAAKPSAKAKPAEKSKQAKAAEDAFRLVKERSVGPGTLLVRLRRLRREDSDNELWSLLRSVAPSKADYADPDRWWDLRRNEVRRALSDGHPKTAYAIAKTHGPLAGENLSEAEFLAGWIALRFLKDPHLAIWHFENSRVPGFGRHDARAAYWRARAELDLNGKRNAQSSFTAAAERFYTFYGGLATQSLHKPAGACTFRNPSQPGQETISAFVKEDAFKAVAIAKQANLEPLLNSYMLDLARQIRDPQQMTLVMELTGRMVHAHVAVRAAKIALLRGYATEAYAFPLLLPKFTQNGPNAKLEPALLNAVTRQESEFNPGTVSRVGARGLMQLMPQTARHMAVSLKMKYEMGRLISDPSYNVTLGSAFLAQLLAGYDGSYVLSLAAYNAGPGRVAGWIKDFGDPRDKSVDPVDWIERIPFTETRQYVQRILESIQIYRCRLENNTARFQLAEDLHRGRPGKLPEIAGVTGSAEEEAP